MIEPAVQEQNPGSQSQKHCFLETSSSQKPCSPQSGVPASPPQLRLPTLLGGLAPSLPEVILSLEAGDGHGWGSEAYTHVACQFSEAG